MKSLRAAVSAALSYHRPESRLHPGHHLKLRPYCHRHHWHHHGKQRILRWNLLLRREHLLGWRLKRALEPAWKQRRCSTGR